MGFFQWASDLICLFWNGIGGISALDVIGKHIFDLMTHIGQAISAIGK